MTSDSELAAILSQAKTIAVVGLSSNQSRPSNRVSAWLQRQGFRILPVNPGETEVLGEKAYPSLDALTEPVDIVDIFRRSEEALPIVEQAIVKNPKLIVMQEGVVHQGAADLARKSGVPLIMDRCILKELARLVPLAKGY